jgi:hypothetical protein
MVRLNSNKVDADEMRALNPRRVLTKPYGRDELLDAGETALG